MRLSINLNFPTFCRTPSRLLQTSHLTTCPSQIGILESPSPQPTANMGLSTCPPWMTFLTPPPSKKSTATLPKLLPLGGEVGKPSEERAKRFGHPICQYDLPKTNQPKMTLIFYREAALIEGKPHFKLVSERP